MKNIFKEISIYIISTIIALIIFKKFGIEYGTELPHTSFLTYLAYAPLMPIFSIISGKYISFLLYVVVYVVLRSIFYWKNVLFLKNI